jgi:hypothetical protein
MITTAKRLQQDPTLKSLSWGVNFECCLLAQPNREINSATQGGASAVLLSTTIRSCRPTGLVHDVDCRNEVR